MPFPPDRGDKIRSSHILRHIAKNAPVHVATFAETDLDLAEEPQLARLAASHCLVRRTKPLAVAGIEALVRSKPVSLTAFHSPRLADYVERTLRERPIATIYVFSGQMGQYVPDWFSGQVLLDFVDVDSAKFEAYAANGAGPRAWLDAREGRLLQREEVRMSRRATMSLLVSAEEADLFAQRLPDTDRDECAVMALRNGIDSTSFDPVSIVPEAPLQESPGPRLIFTGQMDYPPNVAAVERAVRRLMPAIRESWPDAGYHVVGRNPPDSLKALDGLHGCRVWGEVADIRTWLAAADLALVPLEIARGVQNKVLEAMAMQLPVVLSPQAATGIGACDGEHFAIGDDDQALIDHVLALLADPSSSALLGLRARRFVIDELSWEAALDPLTALLPSALHRHEKRAA